MAAEAAFRELERFAAAFLADRPDLRLSRLVGREGDPPAVRRPGRAAVIGAGGVGQVAGRTVLGRDGEDVAASGEGGPLRFRTEREAGHLVRRRNPAGTTGELVRRHVDGDGARGAGAEVEDLERTGLLVDDAPVRLVGAGPTHVPLVLVRELGELARIDLVGIQVQRAVPVRGEVDRVADPHRVAVGALVVRHLDRLQAVDVEDPQVLRPASFVALPVPEVPGHRRVDDALSVGRKIAAARLRHRQRSRQSAGGVDQEQLCVTQVPSVPQRPEQDGLAVGRPAVDLVVVAPARRKGPGGRVEGQLPGRAARRVHDVDLLVAVVLPGEGDLRTVRREPGEQLQAGMGGEARRRAPVRRSEPDVPRVGERDPVAGEVGEAEQPGRLAGLGPSRRRQHGDGQEGGAQGGARHLTGDDH